MTIPAFYMKKKHKKIKFMIKLILKYLRIFYVIVVNISTNQS